jgi:hypothetical protein
LLGSAWLQIFPRNLQPRRDSFIVFSAMISVEALEGILGERASAHLSGDGSALAAAVGTQANGEPFSILLKRLWEHWGKAFDRRGQRAVLTPYHRSSIPAAHGSACDRLPRWIAFER